MVPIDIEALINRACNGYMETADVGLNLDIADIVKQKPGNARKALEKVLKIASDEIDRQASFLAVQLLDCLMVNCGYPVRFYMTRKEYLNLLVKRFPPSPSFQLDHAMKRTLKLINKWKLSLCDKSRHKKDFSNILLMHELLASKAYIFPPVSSEEIDAMVGLELQTLRTKESLQEEEKTILETKLEYYLWRGTPADVRKANEIMKQMIESQDPSNYSTADSQIMQDLQKLADKISLLEDLIENEDDSSSLKGLIDNPTIGQMYRSCRDELPKLLELANCELNEDLMNRIIAITERLMAIKNAVEPRKKNEKQNEQKDSFELKQSTDDIRNIFDDLPLLSPKTTVESSIKDSGKRLNSAQQERFESNGQLAVDLINFNNGERLILRFMNITDSAINQIKLNGKLVKAKLEPFETQSKVISDKSKIVLEYDSGKFELSILNDGIENLLLI